MLYINHWLFKIFHIHLKIGCLDFADNTGFFFAGQKIIFRFGKILYQFPVQLQTVLRDRPDGSHDQLPSDGVHC